MPSLTYDIMMASIPHRHDRLCLLLAEFDRQMQPGVGLRIYYDNLVVPVGEKYGILARSSRSLKYSSKAPLRMLSRAT